MNIFQVMSDLRKGDVALVRSERVKELGDHWVIITGGLVQKPHGLRPQTTSLPAGNMKSFLDRYCPDAYGMVFLKLIDPTAFYQFQTDAKNPDVIEVLS